MTFSEGALALSYLATPGLSNIICSIHISLQAATSCKLSLDVVKAAVRQLRFDHPAIATQIGWHAHPPSMENALFAYEIPTSEGDVDE